MMNEIVTAGPALFAAAEPVIENNPAPMIAPIPSKTNALAPSVFAKPCSFDSFCKSNLSELLL